jgi:hypothetical protein
MVVNRFTTIAHFTANSTMLCVGRTVGEKQNQPFQLSFWSVFES